MAEELVKDGWTESMVHDIMTVVELSTRDDGTKKVTIAHREKKDFEATFLSRERYAQ